jgi:hypothetical protein
LQRHRTREQEEGRKEIREPAERERAWEPAERGRAEGRASDSAPPKDRGWGLEDYTRTYMDTHIHGHAQS